MKFFLILIGLVSLPFSLCTPLHAASSNCPTDRSALLSTEIANLEKNYKALDSTFGKISAANQPFFLKGQKSELVLLFHGFMGSPGEMKPIAEKLNGLGYAVEDELIPGFGANAVIANQYTREMWTRWMREKIEDAEKCFRKVHLVGFSTGGALITDYIGKHPKDSHIASVVLLSPYYRIHNLFYDIIQGSASAVLNKVPVSLIFNTTRFPDVQVMLKRPDIYLDEVPLRTAQEIIALGKEVNARPVPGLPLSIPALVFLSGNDQVIQQQASDELTKRYFAKRVLVFREEGKDGIDSRVPHHVMVSAVSPIVETVENRIVDFYQNL